MPRLRSHEAKVHGHSLTEDVERTSDVAPPEDNVTFDSLFLNPLIVQGLRESGFVIPSPIQLKAIPLGRCGVDLIGQAKSGTGKTCVFSVIALEAIDVSTDILQVIVLAPTREIATQIHDVISSIATPLEATFGLFIGGIPSQVSHARAAAPGAYCHIAVGTPGRVADMVSRPSARNRRIESAAIADGPSHAKETLQAMSNGSIHTSLPTTSVRLLILDEVDKLMEADFREQLDIIHGSLPQRKQVVALSATYPPELEIILAGYMNDPVHVCLDPVAPSLHGVAQFYFSLEKADFSAALQFNQTEHAGQNVGITTNSQDLSAAPVYVRKYHTTLSLLERLPFRQCVVFCNLRARAQKLSNVLNAAGYPTGFISGSLPQKERNAVMEQLRSFQIRVLVSTDLTARGIDVGSVNLVINIDIPENAETYLHRIGRTGRFGTRGVAVTIVVDDSEQADFLQLLASCGTVARALPDGDLEHSLHASQATQPPQSSTPTIHDPQLPVKPNNVTRTHGRKPSRRTRKLRRCKWEQGEFADEGCWAHREGNCPFLHQDEIDAEDRFLPMISAKNDSVLSTAVGKHPVVSQINAGEDLAGGAGNVGFHVDSVSSLPESRQTPPTKLQSPRRPAQVNQPLAEYVLDERLWRQAFIDTMLKRWHAAGARPW
eukprot:m.539865 g.539865  ORF g.539865 m.539865 type:complete len:660 (-) comp22094_c0_seq2:1074-3053(-)